MLGLYNSDGGPVQQLSAYETLRRLCAPSDPIVRGPLAVRADGASPSVAYADVGGILCVLEGKLYEPPGSLPSSAVATTKDSAAAVANVYRISGVPGLATLRGRYATAIWSSVANRGAVTCDLLGTREVFAFGTGGGLIFATELRDLLSLTSRRPGPDSDTLAMWLAEGLCPEGRTFYEGVIRLGPGELIPLGTGRLEPQRYWRLRYTGTVKGTVEDHAHALRQQLERAVGKRLSARSSAVILSGGVDSSVVTSVAARTKPIGSEVRAYSAVFPGAEYDESAKIRRVTDLLGITSSLLHIEPQGALWLALQYVRRWQMPLIAPGALVDVAATREAARDGAEVVLDGQAGDELFGYSRYLISDHLRRGRLVAAVRLAGGLPAKQRPTRRQVRWVLTQVGLKGAAPYRLANHAQRRGFDGTEPAWLLPPLRRRHGELADRWAWKRASAGPLWWRSLSDTLVAAPHRELRLTYLRQRADSQGIIADPPLYDVDLIEHSLRIPPELAFDARFNRPLVREAMRGWLPEDVRLQTTKADLSDFAVKIMTGRDAPNMEGLLLARGAEIRAYAEQRWLQRVWSELLARRSDRRDEATLWRMVAAECWLRAEADSGFADAMLGRPDVATPSVRRVTVEHPT